MSQLEKQINEPLLGWFENEGGEEQEQEQEQQEEAKSAMASSAYSMPEKMDKPTPLSRQQVNQCLMDIEDQMPLKSRVHIEHICTCLKPLPCFKRKPDFRQAIKQCLYDELSRLPPSEVRLKEPKNKEELKNDPFLYLGYGVNAYFASMMHMVKMFTMISLFCIPIFAIYSQNETKAFQNSLGYKTLQYTLGNLGGASVQCMSVPLKNKQIDIICPTGTQIKYNYEKVLNPAGNMEMEKEMKGQIIKYGVMPLNKIKQNICEHQNKGNNMCHDHRNLDYIQQQIEKCSKDENSKKKCNIQFFNDKEELQIFKTSVKDDPKVEENCNKDSNFFVQVACVIPQERVRPRQMLGLLVACIGVLIYFFALVYFDYIRAIEKNKYLDFDVATITAGDYTVEFDMPKASYEYFKKVYYNKKCPMSEIAQFRQYIQMELEDRMSKMPDLGYDEDADAPAESNVSLNQSAATKMSKFLLKQQKIKAKKQKKLNESMNMSQIAAAPKKIHIAQITFAFYNADLILLLKKRGSFIHNENWDKVAECNKEIDTLIKHEDKLEKGGKHNVLDRLQTPCSAFVTFETEEGFQRAKQYNKLVKLSQDNLKLIKEQEKGKKKKNKKVDDLISKQQQLLPLYFHRLLGQEIHLEEASEPTDIIWENRQVKPAYRFKQTILVWIIIAIMLTISGAIIYVCSYKSTSLKLRYPKADCKSTDKLFVGHDDWYLREAGQEYLYNEQLKKDGQNTDYKTEMQCFCKKQGKENKNKIYTINTEEGDVKVPFCANFYKDKMNSFVLGTSISFIIIAVNTILKILIIKLIESIKHDTQSEKLASITNGVFIAQFFNTGILLLLVNAIMTEHSPKFITQFISTGKYFDYTPFWYKDVGAKIVKTMMINSIMPYITLMSTFMVPWIMQKMDGNPYNTKKTSMAKFKMLHGGKDYIIHFKYSNVLNICYITCMYGLGMPILFPISVINFLNQYFCERVIVAYFMKMPPALDDKLVRNFVKMLKWAPLFFLCNGYWMVSNQQIFRNTFHYIKQQSDSMESSHFVTFLGNRHALPLLMMSLGHMTIIVFVVFFSDWMKRVGFTLGQIDIEIDEDLPNFFESITLQQANFVVEKDKYLKEHFHFEENDPDTIERLDSTKMPKKAIQGTAWYTVNSNKDYADAFNYIGPHIKEREKLIEDGYMVHMVKGEGEKKKHMSKACIARRWEQSDMIIILLSLSAIPDKVIYNVDFATEHWSDKLREEMIKYQEEWSKKYEMEFSWQTTEIENEYKEYIKEKKESADTELQKDLMEEKANTVMKDFLKDQFAKFQKQDTLPKQ